MTNTMFMLFLFYIFIINPVLSTKTADDFDSILIENDFVTCYTDRLVIHLYYFPFSKKTIKYNDIH